MSGFGEHRPVRRLGAANAILLICYGFSNEGIFKR